MKVLHPEFLFNFLSLDEIFVLITEKRFRLKQFERFQKIEVFSRYFENVRDEILVKIIRILTDICSKLSRILNTSEIFEKICLKCLIEADKSAGVNVQLVSARIDSSRRDWRSSDEGDSDTTNLVGAKNPKF